MEQSNTIRTEVMSITSAGLPSFQVIIMATYEEFQQLLLSRATRTMWEKSKFLAPDAQISSVAEYMFRVAQRNIALADPNRPSVEEVEEEVDSFATYVFEERKWDAAIVALLDEPGTPPGSLSPPPKKNQLEDKQESTAGERNTG